MNRPQKKRIEQIEAVVRPHNWERYEHVPVTQWPDAALIDYIQSLPEGERLSLMRKSNWTELDIREHELELSRKVEK